MEYHDPRLQNPVLPEPTIVERYYIIPDADCKLQVVTHERLGSGVSNFRLEYRAEIDGESIEWRTVPGTVSKNRTVATTNWEAARVYHLGWKRLLKAGLALERTALACLARELHLED